MANNENNEKAEGYGRIYLYYALRNNHFFITNPADFSACPAWQQLIYESAYKCLVAGRPLNGATMSDVADLRLTEKRGSDLIVWFDGQVNAMKAIERATIEDALDAVEQLKDLAKHFKLVIALERSLQIAKTKDAKECIAEIEKNITDATLNIVKNRDFRVSDIIDEVISDFELAVNGMGPVPVLTGFSNIDNIMRGVYPAEMVTIAGFPGSGKTQLAVQIMINNSINSELPLLYYSLEMTHKQLIQRYIATSMGWSIQDMREGILPRGGVQAIEKMTQLMKKCNMVVETSTDVTPQGIKANFQRQKRKYGKFKAFALDHLHQMKGGANAKDSYHQISQSTAAVANLTKEEELVSFLLSQLKKEDVNRPNTRPRKGDLKDSSSIEADSSHIWFVHREIYNHPEKKQWEGIAEVLERKNRYGETNRDFYLGFKNGFFTDDHPPVPVNGMTPPGSEVDDNPFKEKYTMQDLFKK